MTVYTVHLEGENAEAASFVPERFAWKAFLVPPLWLVWNRLWLALALWCAAFAILMVAPFHSLTKELFLILIGLLCGLEGQEWRRQKLMRQGQGITDIVSGDSQDDAEIHFFHRFAQHAPSPRAAVPLYPSRPAPAPMSATEIPFGLFPEPEKRP